MHVPLNRDAVRDATLAFFDRLRKEPHPSSEWCSGTSSSSTSMLIWNGNGPRRADTRGRVIPVTDRNAYHDRSRKSECRRGYRVLRGLPRRAGQKNGWRARPCRRCRKLRFSKNARAVLDLPGVVCRSCREQFHMFGSGREPQMDLPLSA